MKTAGCELVMIFCRWHDRTFRETVSYPSFAAALQEARDWTWECGELSAAPVRWTIRRG